MSFSFLFVELEEMESFINKFTRMYINRYNLQLLNICFIHRLSFYGLSVTYHVVLSNEGLQASRVLLECFSIIETTQNY